MDDSTASEAQAPDRPSPSVRGRRPGPGRGGYSTSSRAANKRARYQSLTPTEKLRFQAQQAIPAARRRALEEVGKTSIWAAASEHVRAAMTEAVAQKTKEVYEPHINPPEGVMPTSRYPPYTSTAKAIAQEILGQFSGSSTMTVGTFNPQYIQETASPAENTGEMEMEDEDESVSQLQGGGEFNTATQSPAPDGQSETPTPESIDRELKTLAYIMEEFSDVVESRKRLIMEDPGFERNALERSAQLDVARAAIQTAMTALEKYDLLNA